MAAERKDNALADAVVALTVAGLRELLAGHRPEKLFEALVERVVIDPRRARLSDRIQGGAGWAKVTICGVPRATPQIAIWACLAPEGH